MQVVGVKAVKGKRQFLIIGKSYDVTDEVGKAIIKSGRGELKGSKKTTAKKDK